MDAAALGRGARIHIDYHWPHTLIIASKARFGKLQLNFRKNIEGCLQCLGVFGDACGHLKQNAMDLRILFLEEAHEFVVLFYGFKRLDKHCLSTGTGAVNDSIHAALLIRLHRDYEALTAYCDQLVLYRPALGKVP